METDRYLSAVQLAEKLGVKVGTVYGWRKRHTGPPAVNLGNSRTLRYSEAAVDAWLIRQQPETEEAK